MSGGTYAFAARGAFMGVALKDGTMGRNVGCVPTHWRN